MCLDEGEKPVQVSDYGVDELDGTGIVRPPADVKADQFVVEYNANISRDYLIYANISRNYLFYANISRIT